MKHFFTLLFVLGFALPAFCEEEAAETRKPFTSIWFHYINESGEPPVLWYYGSMGHHANRIPDSGVHEICIWKDGTVAWSVFRDKETLLSDWYQATIPVEDVEAALEEIMADYAKHPLETRQRKRDIAFRSGPVFMLGMNYSPRIHVCASRHFETLSMDYAMWRFYKDNREVLQSGDDEAILKAVKITEEKSNPFTMIDYRGMVEHYRKMQAGEDPAKSSERVLECSDEEVLKCATMFTADVEHLFLIEKKMLDLLPPTEGLEKKKPDMKGNLLIEVEMNEGKPEFFYSPITEEQRKEIFGW